MVYFKCDKSECIKTLCRVFCVHLVLIHSAIVIKILFCMAFYCELIENHIFYGIKLLLKLFDIRIHDENSNRNALNYFYLYIIVTNMMGILLYGIVSTSPTKKETNSLIDSLCFLATNIFICFINLIQNSAFLILVVFIGIDDNVNIQMEAAFLSSIEAAQIITLSLLLAAFKVRYSDVQNEKKFLFSARLVENSKNEEPVLIC